MEEKEIARYFKDKFEELFKSSHPHFSLALDCLLPKKITEEEIRFLGKIPTEEEIRECVWTLHPLKSSGPDGFPGSFFRTYWLTVKEKMCHFVRVCFSLGRILASANQSFIVLIPKNDLANNFNYFRPISLCNLTYKIIAKILANRLSGISERLISPNQGAFVRGRWIAENTVIAQEVVHCIKKHKRKDGLMMLKKDIRKAYDCMEWSFLVRILKAWGFNELCILLIYSCMSTVEFSLLLNGNISETFKPGSGLRQDDQLSPTLFIMGYDILTRLLAKEETAGNFNGLKLTRMHWQ